MKNSLPLFETDADRFQPDMDFKYSSDPEGEQQYVLDQQFLAFLVGAVALGLPFAMLVGAGIGTCFYDSISHFYYSQFFGDLLVSALVFIGTFLVAYRAKIRARADLPLSPGCPLSASPCFRPPAGGASNWIFPAGFWRT